MLTTVDYDVTIPMSDGVKLCADVYRPSADGTYPVIVTRTPYLKETERFVVRARYFAESGYVYIVQDVRGRGKSTGIFYPFFNEAEDGYETLSWSARQSWSNGLLGTIGASYSAWTQWLCAGLNHPNLVTMITEASPPDFFQCLPYQYGAFSLPMLSWLIDLNGRNDVKTDEIDWERVLSARPLNRLDSLCGSRNQIWQDWLAHDREDGYWEKLAFNRKMKAIKLPIFHVSGWYDDVLIGTLLNYAGMCSGSNGGNQTVQPQRLLVGPWPHRLNTTSKFGKIDFGEAGIIDLFAVQRDWFDSWLKPTSKTAVVQPVRFYALNGNKWVNTSAWPPTNAEIVKFYLHSQGSANTRNGNGTLDTTAPLSEPHDEYLYDPMRPVPFLSEPGWIQIGGPDDYSQIEARDDILVYSTAPLERDLVIAGPITVNLFAASSARDTDFTAKLLDASPDGSALRLNDGIVRARFRDSLLNPTAIVPDSIYRYTINCSGSCYVFRKGHRIRLEISSSAFPKFDPNLNTGNAIASDEECIQGRQRIFHDNEHPSHIVLHVWKGLTDD